MDKNDGNEEKKNGVRNGHSTLKTGQKDMRERDRRGERYYLRNKDAYYTLVLLSCLPEPFSLANSFDMLVGPRLIPPSRFRLLVSLSLSCEYACEYTNKYVFGVHVCMRCLTSVHTSEKSLSDPAAVPPSRPNRFSQLLFIARPCANVVFLPAPK